MSTIDEIMQAVYQSQCAASAYETSSGRGKRQLEIDMFAADGKVQAMITAAIAEARREGAEAMREAVESLREDADEIFPPTGKRQAVRLTDDDVWKSDAIMGANSAAGLQMSILMRLVRAIEAAVLAANGRGDAK